MKELQPRTKNYQYDTRICAYLSNDTVAFVPNERNDVIRAEYDLRLSAHLHWVYTVRTWTGDVLKAERQRDNNIFHPTSRTLVWVYIYRDMFVYAAFSHSSEYFQMNASRQKLQIEFRSIFRAFEVRNSYLRWCYAWGSMRLESSRSLKRKAEIPDASIDHSALWSCHQNLSMDN